MKQKTEHQGVIVPMITPVAAAGSLDEAAVDRMVDFLIAGGVDGIFVMGTTGESASLPHPFRRSLVERTVARVQGRVKVYAGLGDLYPKDAASGNDYLQAGAQAVVARPPVSFPVEKLLPWFKSLLSDLDGPMMLYNIPSTTNVSIPLDVVAELAGHPKLLGIKDSENSLKRLEELLKRFGGKPDFAIFVGVGVLMARGLRLGAAGVVPSTANLIPEVCSSLCSCAERADWAGVERNADRMNEVAALYQQGRSLGESLAVLKGVLSIRGLCEPYALPPLRGLEAKEIEALRQQMGKLGLLNGGGAEAPASRPQKEAKGSATRSLASGGGVG